MPSAPRPSVSPVPSALARSGPSAASSAEEVLRADAIEARAWVDLMSAAPTGLASSLGLRVEQVGGATALIAPRLPVSLFNRVIGLGGERPATEAGLDALLRLYREAGVREPWVHVGPAGRPAALTGWLEARGFRPAARRAWAKMLRGPGPVADVPCDLTIAEVGPIDASALAQVLAEAHSMPPVLAPWIAALVGRPGWRACGALEQGRLVAGGLLFVDGQDGWLGMAGTLPSYRKRGAQGALMVKRLRDAAASGCVAIATETGEPLIDEANPSLDNMIRCGFHQVCSRLNYAPAP